MRAEFLAGEGLASGQGALDEPGRASLHGRVESQLLRVAGHRLAYTWSRELEHPADVGWRDEVPRRPHHVGTEDPALIEGLLDRRAGRPGRKTEPECPLRRQVLLGLHGT